MLLLLVLERLLPLKPVLLAVRAVLEDPLAMSLLPAKVAEEVRVLKSWINCLIDQLFNCATCK